MVRRFLRAYLHRDLFTLDCQKMFCKLNEDKRKGWMKVLERHRDKGWNVGCDHVVESFVDRLNLDFIL